MYKQEKPAGAASSGLQCQIPDTGIIKYSSVPQGRASRLLIGNKVLFSHLDGDLVRSFLSLSLWWGKHVTNTVSCKFLKLKGKSILGMSRVPQEWLEKQPRSSKHADDHKHPQEQPAHHHGHVFPVVLHLKDKSQAAVKKIRTVGDKLCLISKLLPFHRRFPGDFKANIPVILVNPCLLCSTQRTSVCLQRVGACAPSFLGQRAAG